MPFENTYLPLVPFLVASGSFLTRYLRRTYFIFCPHLHIHWRLYFSFCLREKLSGRIAPSFWAALLWSLFSPAEPIRKILENAGGVLWSSRRLLNIVDFGETPHNVALCLVPLALLTLVRYFEKPVAQRFAISTVAIAAVMLSNAFGIVVIVISSVMLCAGAPASGFDWRDSIDSISTDLPLPAAVSHSTSSH